MLYRDLCILNCGPGVRNSSWASPILAGERLYAVNRNADVFVLRASPKFECLATNSIGSEPMNASLAVSDGDIFIRTDKQLWCIGERNGIPKTPAGRAGSGVAAGAGQERSP